MKIKTPEEIAIMREGNRRLKHILNEVLAAIKPGITTLELDSLAEKLIKEQQGAPSFKEVQNYSWSSCINLNEGIVHGIPGKEVIRKGDVVSIDVGFYFRGYHSDMAWTVVAGEPESGEKKRFLEAGRKALAKALKKAVVGNRVGDITAAIEKEIRSYGYSPVRELTGHGIGRELHESPLIPGVLSGKIEQTPELQKGATLAIEVIYTQGKPDLVLKDDDWTIETRDGSLAGLFEDSVIVG